MLFPIVLVICIYSLLVSFVFLFLITIQDLHHLKSFSEPVLHCKGWNQALDKTAVSSCHIDASKICHTIPEDFLSSSLGQLASSAAQYLGFPASVITVEHQAVKLLLYEKGDHQSYPFDQDAKPGDILKLFPIIN